MKKIKWSDLTIDQKTKGIGLFREREDFLLFDSNDELITETDEQLIIRIGEEYLFKTALKLFRKKQLKITSDNTQEL